MVTPVKLAEQSPEDLVAANLPAGGVLAYDPWLHTSESVKRLEKRRREGGRQSRLP